MPLESKNGKYRWRGHSDTETLLSCIEEYGIEATLKKLNGMFALLFTIVVKNASSLREITRVKSPFITGSRAIFSFSPRN